MYRRWSVATSWHDVRVGSWFARFSDVCLKTGQKRRKAAFFWWVRAHGSARFLKADVRPLSGRFEEASQILANLEERIPDLLEPVLRRINVERRRGCPEKVEELYRKCISQADNVALKSHYAGKLARFLSKVGRLRQRCCLRHDPPPLHLLHAGWGESFADVRLSMCQGSLPCLEAGERDTRCAVSV